MVKIVFVTKNKNKIARAESVLSRYEIDVLPKDVETPEIQAFTSQEVAEFSAKYAGEKLGVPVIKVDVAFHIDSLNGFPGPYSKYINEWLSAEQLNQLCAGVKNNTARFTESICYYNPKTLLKKLFVENTEGSIKFDEPLEDSWPIDQIFIPDGSKEVLAHFDLEERARMWNLSNWKELAKFLSTN